MPNSLWPVQSSSGSWPIMAHLFSQLQGSPSSPNSLELSQPATATPARVHCPSWGPPPAVHHLLTFYPPSHFQVFPGVGLGFPCPGRGGSHWAAIIGPAVLQWSCKQPRSPAQGPETFLLDYKISLPPVFNVLWTLWLPNFVSAGILLAVHCSSEDWLSVLAC